jgi:DNA-binding transcriptional ArsR family regulator
LPKTKNKKDGIEQIVAKAFAHPLRVQILAILSEKVASPNMLAQQLDESLNLVAYHVRVLEKYDCIELVDTKQRRGATEHFYRAIRRQLLTDDQWAELPASLRPGMATAVLKSIFEDIEAASSGGTLEEVDDLHITRTPMVLDKEGWEDVSKLLQDALDRLPEIQAEATNRMAVSKEPGALAKVHMMHFKSPSADELKSAETSGKPETTAS